MLAALLRILQLALVAATVYLALAAVSPFVGASPEPHVSLPPVAASESKNAGFERYQVISQRNLFNAREDAIALEPAEEQLEESRLNLVLLGTTAARVPEFSVASVEDVAQREILALRIGDRVAGARVVRIERRRVVIDNGGVRELLTLDDERAAGPVRRRGSASARSSGVLRAGSRASSPSRTKAAAARSSPRAATRSASARSKRGGDSRSETSSSSAGSSGTALRTSGRGAREPTDVSSSEAHGGDTGAASEEVVSAPAFEEPPQRSDSSYFEQRVNPNNAFVSTVGHNALGLSPGDQITAVNGVDVSDRRSLESQVRRFMAEGRATLTIQSASGGAHELNLVLDQGGPAR